MHLLLSSYHCTKDTALADFVFNIWILAEGTTTLSWKDIKLLIFINIFYFFFVEKVSPELPDINQRNSSDICN